MPHETRSAEMLQANDIDEELAKLLASGMLETRATLTLVARRLNEYAQLKALGASIH